MFEVANINFKIFFPNNSKEFGKIRQALRMPSKRDPVKVAMHIRHLHYKDVFYRPVKINEKYVSNYY